MTESSHVLRGEYMLQWYRIESVLGQGGFGITYLARDTNLDIAVAIKEYLPTEFAVRETDSTVHARSEDLQASYIWGRDRFLDEARLLATFDHPAIVRVHTFLEANNTAYMVMRYEDGISLRDWFKKRRFSEAELQALLRAVMEGLEVIHARKIIHRDIKPANIYLRSNGQPVLLDFGSARHALGEATRHITAMVSSGFSAPEQYATDASAQGPWTDIYGLAATAYYGMTGRPPLDAMDRSQRLLSRATDDLVATSELAGDRYSEAFCAAIDRGLAFRREDRPASVAAWRRDFPEFEAPSGTRSTSIDTEAPTEVPPVSPPAASPPATDRTGSSGVSTRSVTVTVTRGGMVMATVVGALIVLAAVLAVYLLRDDWRSSATGPGVAPLSSFQDRITDGRSGPKMQVLPPGVFLMGAGALEPDAESDEHPQHEQVIAEPFAIGENEVTVGDFEFFVAETGYVTDGERDRGCVHYSDAWHPNPDLNWRNPGFEQSQDEPVVCVTLKDARAYVDWLSAATGRHYRLPSEAEWEYAARAGTRAARYWGDQSKTACQYANTSDEARARNVAGIEGFDCRDGYAFTSPVGSFRANAFALDDMLGNVWEWTADCWRPNYLATAADGECGKPVLRGGSWSSKAKHLRAANRYEDNRGNRSDFGFRVVSDLTLQSTDDE